MLTVEGLPTTPLALAHHYLRAAKQMLPPRTQPTSAILENRQPIQAEDIEKEASALLRNACSSIRDERQRFYFEKALDDVIDLCHADEFAQKALMYVSREFPEIVLGNDPIVGMRKVVGPYRHLFVQEFQAASEAVQRLAANVDVMVLARSLARIPQETGIILRTLFLADRRKAESLLAILSNEQKAIVRHQIIRTEDGDDFSPLHLRPGSFLSVLFADFVAKHDSALLPWWSKKKQDLQHSELVQLLQSCDGSTPSSIHRFDVA